MTNKRTIVLPGFTAKAGFHSQDIYFSRLKNVREEKIVPQQGFMCGGMCLVCAIALADPVPFDEIMACGACFGCASRGWA